MTLDHTVEFHEALTTWLSRQLGGQGGSVEWNGTDVTRAVFNYIWYTRLHLRESYCRNVAEGGADYFARHELHIPPPPANHAELIADDLYNHPWRGVLAPLAEKGVILVFADSLRHMDYLRPAVECLRRTGRDIIVLTRSSEIAGYLDCEEVSVLNYRPLMTAAVIKSGLAQVNAGLAAFVHTLMCYIHWIRPAAMICCDGCQTQYQLAAIFCRGLSIPAVCLQFGWPGFIHAGFQKLPYTHFLTWGRAFGEILAESSPDTEFISVGRLGDVDPRGPHDAVTFFLQAPAFVATDETIAMQLRLVELIATRYPGGRIIVRPHPEAGLPPDFGALVGQYANVSVDGNQSVDDTYRQTLVAVSHFSSCLVESEVFGCQPLMFNPTPGFDYPLLDAAHTATGIPHFMVALERLLDGSTAPRDKKPVEATGALTCRNFSNFINKLIN